MTPDAQPLLIVLDARRRRHLQRWAGRRGIEVALPYERYAGRRYKTIYVMHDVWMDSRFSDRQLELAGMLQPGGTIFVIDNVKDVRCG